MMVHMSYTNETEMRCYLQFAATKSSKQFCRILKFYFIIFEIFAQAFYICHTEKKPENFGRLIYVNLKLTKLN